MISVEVVEMERAVARVNLQAVLYHIVVVAVKEKVHIMALPGKSASVVAPYGTGADNTVSYFSLMHKQFYN